MIQVDSGMASLVFAIWLVKILLNHFEGEGDRDFFTRRDHKKLVHLPRATYDIALVPGRHGNHSITGIKAIIDKSKYNVCVEKMVNLLTDV